MKEQYVSIALFFFVAGGVGLGILLVLGGIGLKVTLNSFFCGFSSICVGRFLVQQCFTELYDKENTNTKRIHNSARLQIDKDNKIEGRSISLQVHFAQVVNFILHFLIIGIFND